MPDVNLPYVDAELTNVTHGDRHFWRHLHWGYFADPEVVDDSPARYLAAAEALTDLLLTTAGINTIGDHATTGDHATIGDIGCGFAGTLDHIRTHHPQATLHGLNIDHRQLSAAQQLLTPNPDQPLHLVTADACHLPYPDHTFDHLLALEAIFHFSSRKTFFREAARTLKPDGTLTLTDFLVTPEGLPTVATTMAAVGFGKGSWYGRLSKPLSSAGYERLGRGAGLDLVSDDDITIHTLPTYAALHRLNRETRARTSPSENPTAADDDLAQARAGLATTDALEALASAGHLGYHVLSFRR